MASLANQTISSTYDGLIKTSSDNAVPVSGVQALEDGSGNALALSVGRSGNGVTVSGNLAVDTNTLYVDAANNRVGIGTSSPAAKIHIASTGNSYEDTVIINSSSTSKLRVTNDSNSATNRMFITHNFSRSTGSFVADDSGVGTSSLAFNDGAITLNTDSAGSTAPTERMRIDSSGRVSINDTVSGSVATNYNPELLVGGNIVARSLTANEALIEIGGDATSAFITAGKQDGSQTARALRFEIGTSEKVRITGDGLTFNGDTAAANALDDYEEGTFTPTMSGYSGVTYSSQIGHYTKIGRFVQVSFYMSISNIGTFTGNSFINGLPFSVGTTQAFATGGQLNIMTALNVTRDEHFAGFYNGTSNLFIYSKSGLTTYNGNNHQAGIYSGTLTYFV